MVFDWEHRIILKEMAMHRRLNYSYYQFYHHSPTNTPIPRKPTQSMPLLLSLLAQLVMCQLARDPSHTRHIHLRTRAVHIRLHSLRQRQTPRHLRQMTHLHRRPAAQNPFFPPLRFHRRAVHLSPHRLRGNAAVAQPLHLCVIVPSNSHPPASATPSSPAGRCGANRAESGRWDRDSVSGAFPERA